MIEYDLCLYQKWNEPEHGTANDEHFNSDKLCNYLKNTNVVFSSFKDTLKYVKCTGEAGQQNLVWDRNFILEDFSEKSIIEYNQLRNKAGFDKKSCIKLGIVSKYLLLDRVLCIDKTHLIISLQRNLRYIIINKKIKANIIHRYLRKWSCNPYYKFARKLILIQYSK